MTNTVSNRRQRARATCIDLYDYAHSRPARPRGRPEFNLDGWQVSDDWPEQVPVTEAEIDLFEAWFGDLFDELFVPQSKEP